MARMTPCMAGLSITYHRGHKQGEKGEQTGSKGDWMKTGDQGADEKQSIVSLASTGCGSNCTAYSRHMHKLVCPCNDAHDKLSLCMHILIL